MNVMISCYALYCWAQFCSVGCMTLNSQRQYLGAKDFFLFFLIPDGLRCGLFAEKMQQNDVLFGIAILSGNIQFDLVIQVSQTGNSLYPVDF